MIEQGGARHHNDGAGERTLLPLSPQQARWWRLDEVFGTARCQSRMKLEFRGRLDHQALQAAFERLISRHAILRARFRRSEGGVEQHVGSGPEALSFSEHYLDGRWSADQLCRLDAEEPLSLESGPLIRGSLMRLPDHAYMLLITLHPIICDGASLDRLIRELLILYKAGLTRDENALSPITTQYTDLIFVNSPRQADGAWVEKLARWKELLSGSTNPWITPSTRFSGITGVLRNEHVSVELPRELTARLRGVARTRGLKLRPVLLGAWARLLAGWFKQPTAIFGVELLDRTRAKEMPTVGPLVDLVALEIGVEASTTVLAFLQEVDRAAKQRRGAAQDSWEKLCELPPDGGRPRPVIPVAISVDAQPCLEKLTSIDVPAITIERVSTEKCWPCAAISVSLEDRGPAPKTALHYFSGSVTREVVQRVGDQWLSLLEGMASNPRGFVGNMPLLNQSERERAISGLSDTAEGVSLDRTAHGLFEAQVQKSPNAIAVEHEGRCLTYAQLNSRANQLARFLVNQGVCPDEVVGVCIDRSLEMVIGLLGILKAGGAYLPLDPNYPRSRLEQMLNDARPKVLITETELMGVLPSSQGKLVSVDQELRQLAGFLDENLDSAELGLGGERLVYVIYTSGSTGKPKGIAMPHRAMVNLIEWHRETFGNSEGQRVLQFAALSFDVAFQEIFSTLCTGGTVVLLDEWVRRDAKALAEFLANRAIHRFFVPPVMLHCVVEHCELAGFVPTSLRDVITAGEQLRISTAIRAFFGKLKGCRLHNHYGPTESHVVTALTLTGDSAEWPVLPSIGRPIANTQIYVLDEQRQPVGCGMTAEIYIGGANLARGYLNQPELTKQRFVPDPYSAHSSARLYRTGDLARWTTEGFLEYLGRNDDQVKIRGFRIELREIEAQLARHELVREVAVAVREDTPGEKSLVAYVTRRRNGSPSVEDLREHLKAVLPGYMVPSAIVILEKLPLTPSGKVDRKSLPAPDLEARVMQVYESPRGEMELLLAKIWQDLLHVARVGRNDDFFKLGGHSLLIMQMRDRLRQAGLSTDTTNIYVSPILAEFAQTVSSGLSEYFESPQNLIPPVCDKITPQMLPMVDLTSEQIERIAQTVPGGVANIQDIYPLAPLQEGILFHHLLQGKGGGDTYVLPMLLRLSSRHTLDGFIEALRQVIQRHDILRTAVLWEQLPQPVQVVYRRAAVPVEQFTLDIAQDAADQLMSYMKPEYQRLDLRHAPMMRLQIAPEPHSDRWFALLQLHHLIGDHESEDLLLNEISACLNGNNLRGIPMPLPFRDHVARCLAQTKDVAEEFFRSKLCDIDEPTAPFGLLEIYGNGSHLEELSTSLEAHLSRRVRLQARHMGVSPAALFHCVWALVLSRTSGRDDVVFGTLLLGRVHGDSTERLTLGMFINTLPLRINLEGAMAKELVERVHRELGELLKHEQASLAVAQRCSRISGTAPLFTALLNYRYARGNSDRDRWKRAGFEVFASREWTNYPIVLSVDDEAEGFSLTMQTDRRVDPRRVLDYVHAGLTSLVEALERSPRAPALSLQVLPEMERQQVIAGFNPVRQFSQHKLIHELFEAQVLLRPDAIAVVCEGDSLTYAELNGRANQVAWYLRKRDVRCDQLVGLCVERSLEMVVGLLGILKAGGAYLPLDPTYPPERLAYMLEDAAPGIVLTEERLKDSLPRTTAEVVALDSALMTIGEDGTSNLSLRPPGLTSEHLAYVIYTSGSTGKPKGVMVEHRNVVRLFAATESWFGFSERDVWTLFHSFAFDFSVWELWGALIYGGRVVIVPHHTARSPREFYGLLCREGITVLNQTPSAFAQLIEAQGERPDLKHVLRVVIFGGEALEFRALRRWVERNGVERPQLVNMYGITETTVHVTHRLLSREEVESERGSVVGRPIPDLTAYLLDRHRQPVPIGVVGEIYVGGAGVARGYLNRPELTAERFLPDPFAADPKARMYKTGDLGKWRADGMIEYLGRNDDQVKIRGFRIELGEIEALLVCHPQVRESVVLAREDVPGEKRLVAYVIAQDASDARPSAEGLREHLKAVLPEYMIPSAFVILESFPLTPNGKLDRGALPAPELGAYASREYEAPQGHVEEVLAGIWQELLNVERVGRYDSFFELGGDSLLATRVITHVSYSLNVDIPMRVIFEKPTLEAMAVFISQELTAENMLEAS